MVNEFESYLEDRSIVDQQTMRLPEEEVGSSRILLCTIQVRKIKSNVENILQLLWERETEQQRRKNLETEVFTGDKAIDELESEEDGLEAAEPLAPDFMDMPSRAGLKAK